EHFEAGLRGRRPARLRGLRPAPVVVADEHARHRHAGRLRSPVRRQPDRLVRRQRHDRRRGPDADPARRRRRCWQRRHARHRRHRRRHRPL
ncbi:MAG: hypothetical protein AVDCRST_MAG04-1867, partial [uncultured Acetobacteraceae bacterium]